MSTVENPIEYCIRYNTSSIYYNGNNYECWTEPDFRELSAYSISELYDQIADVYNRWEDRKDDSKIEFDNIYVVVDKFSVTRMKNTQIYIDHEKNREILIEQEKRRKNEEKERQKKEAVAKKEEKERAEFLRLSEKFKNVP
jgi:rubrerythrin